MPKQPISVDKDAAFDDEVTPSRGVMVGRITDLSRVPGLVLSYGIARVDTGVHVTSKDPDKFRLLGKTGPGHIDHPLTRRAQKDGREVEIVVAKIRRNARLLRATAKRKENSKEQKILQLSEQYKHLDHSAAETVAQILGVTADYVRRVVKRNRTA